MALSSSEVAKIAHLARLQLSTDEEAAVTARLNDILGMIDRLQAADTTGVSPMAHPLDATQPLRDDTVTETDQRERFQAIAPATDAGCYLVPKVIE
ncbi:MAG: Asp-tRNA(Asn)/Glu-tRNA(Gln) amidotransferase subunit GatC [Moraxellaceae bacterium]|nr:Asp-tRNA(Asn)/Glu-tRNA(Gln) amidotransferase subunit GatC [Moraxellaceae bacterium]